jgi:hypothetical protein
LESLSFVTDKKGKRTAVVIDLKIYQRMVDALEEIEDVRAYDLSKTSVVKELKSGAVSSIEALKRKRRT